MGASLTHGREISVESELLNSGRRVWSIVSSDGKYEGLAYSSVDEMIEYAASKGIDRTLWPVYYQPLKTIDMDEVYEKCNLLEIALARLSVDEIRENRWLTSIAEWLSSGEKICITE